MAASLATVEEAVELGSAYFLELIIYDYEGIIDGYCAQYTSKLTCLNRLIRALTWDIDGEYLTDNTQKLYELLMIQISTYPGAVLPIDPNVVIPGQTVIVAAGDVLQTAVVFPYIDDVTPVDSYTFAELIGATGLTVYRGTGTTLRAHTGAADNEFAQFDSATGELTFLNQFSDGESLWVEYKTT